MTWTRQRAASHDARGALRSSSAPVSWVLVALCLQVFVSIAFKGMAAIALPDLQRDLGASLQQLQWVLNGYTLALAAVAVGGGALGDVFGRRRLLLLGLAVFFAGSATCAVSPTATVLDLACGAFGLGAGLSFAPAVAMVSDSFEDRRRASAFGILGAVSSAAGACASILGGALIHGWGWRAVFVFCCAFAAAALLSAARWGNSGREVKPAPGSFDWWGLAAFSTAILAMNFALIRGNALGFGSARILASFALAAVAATLFVAGEVRRGGDGGPRHALVPRSVVNPANIGAGLVGVSSSFVSYGLLFYVALYFGNVRGAGPVQIGLHLLPLTAVGVMIAPLAGRLMRWVSPRFLLAAGMTLMAIGFLLMHGLDSGSSWTRLLPGFVVAGLGSGALTPPMVLTSTSVVTAQRAGVSAGINNTARQIGTSLGVCGLGALLQSHIAAQMAHLAGSSSGSTSSAVAGGILTAPTSLPPAARRAFTNTASRAFFSGLNELFVIMALVAIAGALAGLLLVRERDFIVDPRHAGRAVDPSEVSPAATPRPSRHAD